MADSSVEDVNNHQTGGVTETILREAIQIRERRDDVVIIEKHFSSGSDPINNFCSVGSFITLKAEIGGHEREYTLFVKKAHEDAARKELLLGDLQVFKREAAMYSELIPTMEKMQREICGHAFGPSVPDYYNSIVNRDTGIIILQNCAPGGYCVGDVGKGLDYEQTKLVMKEIASFHALSWAMKKSASDYRNTYSFLSTSFFNEYPVENIVGNSIRSAIELAKARMSDDRVKEAILKLSSIDMNQTKRRLCQPIEPFAVICHGDFHLYNILFKSKNNEDNSRPGKLKLIDFQSVIYAPPTIDLAVFFYSSTTRETRKRYLKELLQIYHTEFIQCLKRLNLTFEEFSLSVLEEQFAQSVLYGILLACHFVPHFMADAVEFSGYSQANVDDIEKASLEIAKRLPLFCDKVPAIQDRLFDNFRDLAEISVL